MRLQLTVQRHGLPPAQLLWTVSTSDKLLQTAPGAGTTISQFLEQVNEIIPLEADDWGLEDYAVEVRGFECLHFSELSQVLREDDEVCIRPLQTSDLRVRKFSGRHQIAADGKHLIDGVAFGRPFLRRADRPVVRIPPRKRRRIIYGEEEDSIMDSHDNHKQVVVRGLFDNADQGEDEDDEESDEDFNPEEVDNEGLEDELEGLHDDLQADEEEDDTAIIEGVRTRSRRKSAGLGLQLLESDAYSNPLLDHYSQEESLAGPSALRVKKRRAKGDLKNSISKNLSKPAKSPQRVNRHDSTGSNKSVRFKNGDLATPATVFEAEDNDGDEEFDLTGSDGFADFDGSDKENTEPADDAVEPLDTSDSSSSSLSESDLSGNEIEDDDDETSSSGTSSADSDSDSECAPEHQSINCQGYGNMDDISSMSSSITSSSDTGPDQGNQDGEAKPVPEDVTPNTSVGELTAARKTRQPNPPVPPGGGKQSTRTRNMRRKASLALKRHIKNGDLPEGASIEDVLTLKEKSCSTMPKWMVEHRLRREATEGARITAEKATIGGHGEVNLPSALSQAIAVKGQSLLSSLQSEDGIDVTAEKLDSEAVGRVPNDNNDYGAKVVEGEHDDELAQQHTSRVAEICEPEEAREAAQEGLIESQEAEKRLHPAVQVPDSLPKQTGDAPAEATQTPPEEVPLPTSTPPDAFSAQASVPSRSQTRRAKLDLAGSKRLLFGSLGLKTPKTKDDESALRSRLTKDVKPVKPVKERVAEIEAASIPANNDDSWKDKIELAAVECCHDGIVLSTPPFPFVQRWDPSQKGSYSKKKGKKNKKRKRNDQSYYEENNEDSPNPESPSKVARQESYSANAAQPQFEYSAYQYNQAYQDRDKSRVQYVSDSAAANEQLLRETSASATCAAAEAQEEIAKPEDLPDLPSLPTDLSTYQELRKQDCSAGAVIAFKKFLMSAETNWQPGISEYLTAVVSTLDEAGRLHMTLARRDRPKREARYHEETGERIYGKFEMPGYDDEEADLDSSKLEMPLNELISPLLILSAEQIHESSERQVIASSKPDEDLIGDEAQRTTSEPHAPVSFDGTMDNPALSDAEVNAPLDSARLEITDMIHDAGWRSSLGSGVGRALHAEGDELPTESQEHDDDAPLAFQSPTFRGFDSSPQSHGAYSTPLHLPTEAQVSQVDTGQANVSDHFASSSSKSVLEYPILPQINDVESDELLHNQRQHRSVSLENNLQQATPQESVSPPPVKRGRGQSQLSPVPSLQSQNAPKSTAHKSVPALDGRADSSDEFPELFSQAFEARMSQEPVVESSPSSQPTSEKKLPKSKGRFNSSQKKSKNGNGFWKTGLSRGDEEEGEEDGDDFRTSPCQADQSSQVVDLALSSGPLEAEHPHNEDVDMSSYKSSGGRVDKGRGSDPTRVARRETRRKTRSAVGY